MTIREYLEEYLGETEEGTYKNVADIDFFKLLRMYGRAITLYEFMRQFEKIAGQNHLNLNRDRLYAAAVQRLNNQSIDNDVRLRDLGKLDEVIYFNFRTELKKKEDFFEGELRVIAPKLLEETYTNAFKNYYQLRFVELRDSYTAISKVRNEMGPQLKNANAKVREALNDGEVIAFLAAFYKHSLEHSPDEAKHFSSGLLTSLKLVDRMTRKYQMTEEDRTTLKYMLYKIVQELGNKI